MKLVSLFNPVSLGADPETADNGDLYYNSSTGEYRAYLDGGWITLATNRNIKLLIAPEIFNVGSPDSASFSGTLHQYYSENIVNCLSASLTQIVIPRQEDFSIIFGSRVTIIRSGGPVEIVTENEDVIFSPPSDIYLTKMGTEVKLTNIAYNQWTLSGEFPDLY